MFPARSRRKWQRAKLLLFAIPPLALLLFLIWTTVAQTPTSAPPPVKLTGPGRVVAPTERTGMVYSTAFSPDSQTLVSGDDKGRVQLWDTSTAKVRQTLTGHRGIVHSVAFSRDGTRLVSGGAVYHAQQGYLLGGEVKLWDVKSGKLLRSWNWPKYYVRKVAFSPDDKTVAVGGTRSTDNKLTTDIEILNAQDGKLLRILPERQDANYEVSQLIFSPDGKWIASWLLGEGKLWDVASGKLIRQLTLGAGMKMKWVDALAFSPDGKLLAHGHFDGTLELEDAHTGAVVLKFTSQKQGPFTVVAVAFSADGKQLMSMDPFELSVWDTQTGALLKRVQGGGVDESVVISPNGKIVAGKAGNDLVLWRIAP